MAMKKKGYAKGGAMKKPIAMKKGGAAKKMGGGKMKKKGMAKGGKMPMVTKGGMSVPAFAADGKGKMKKGGPVKKKMMGGRMKKKGMAKGGIARGSGAARPQKFRKNG